MRLVIVIADSESNGILRPGEMYVGVEIDGRKRSMCTLDAPEGWDEALKFARDIAELERQKEEIAA